MNPTNNTEKTVLLPEPSRFYGPVTRLGLWQRFPQHSPRAWVLAGLAKMAFLASVLYLIWG